MLVFNITSKQMNQSYLKLLYVVMQRCSQIYKANKLTITENSINRHVNSGAHRIARTNHSSSGRPSPQRLNQSQPSRQQWAHTLCEPIITQLLITGTDNAIQCAELRKWLWPS